MAGDLKKDERGDDAALMHMATEFKEFMLEQKRIEVNGNIDVAKAQTPVMLKAQEVAHEREKTIGLVAKWLAATLCLCVVGVFTLVAMRGTPLRTIFAAGGSITNGLGLFSLGIIIKEIVSHFRKPPQ